MAFFEAKKAGGGQLVFDYKTWLASAGLSATGYANLDAVLQDELAVRKLMTIHAAVDYLAGWKTTDEDIVKILSNDICAKWITLRDYALDTLDKEYRSLMESLGKYYYGEWALMPQVPKMTSNTAPYGEVVYDSYYNPGGSSTRYPYYAFDGDLSTNWHSNKSSGSAAGAYIGYKFNEKVIVKEVVIIFAVEYSTECTIKIQGLNDSNSWVDVETKTLPVIASGETVKLSLNNSTGYLGYRIYFPSAAGSVSTYAGGFSEVQFYAWAPKGNVPIMTSNTAPYGTASAYQVFDGDSTTTASGTDFSYQFINPVCPKSFACKNTSGQDITGGTLQASNDGSTWVTPVDGQYYLNLRVHFASSTTVATVQFYGRMLKVSVPVMTSNTAPYGTVSASTYIETTAVPYMAFDGNESTWWQDSSSNNTDPCWVSYDFGKPVRLCFAKSFNNRLTTAGSGGAVTADMVIEGSNDGTNWTEISDVIRLSCPNDSGANTTPLSVPYIPIFDNAVYSKFRLLLKNKSRAVRFNETELSFFGLDYSEYDWDADNPRHYLYDHGVELETLDVTTSKASDATITKEPYQIVTKNGTATYTFAFGTTNSAINLSAYNYLISRGGNTMYTSVEIDAFSNKPTSYDNVGSYRLAIAGGVPMTYLDISQVNQSAYPGFGRRGSNDYLSISEWWLE